MAWTASTFKTAYPEFEALADALVEAKLAEATRRLDARVFGARADDAVGLQAAHLLALSPFGQHARLESDKGDTTYRQELQRMMRASAGGPWTIGQLPDGTLLP